MLTIPKRLRLHTRFDRKLLGKLCACAWTCLQAEVRRLLGRDDVAPGMVAAIQTHGELLHWHPHFHVLLTCGAFGLWCASSPRAPPADGDWGSHPAAHESGELTFVDETTFWATF